MSIIEDIDNIILKNSVRGRQNINTSKAIAEYFENILNGDKKYQPKKKKKAISKATLKIIQTCIDVVNEAYAKEQRPITISEIRGKRRFKPIIYVRFYTAYCLNKVYKKTQVDIGHMFNYKDHTPVTHAIQEVEGWVFSNKREAKRLAYIIQMLKNNIENSLELPNK